MTGLDFTDRLGAFLNGSKPMQPKLRNRYLVLSLAVAVVAVAVIALGVKSPSEEVHTVATTSIEGPEAEPIVPTSAALPENELGDAPQACMPAAIAAQVRLNQSFLVDYSSAGSPADLARTTVVVRGQLVLVDVSSGVPVLQVKVRDAVGVSADRIDSSFAIELSYPVDQLSGRLVVGDFLAFVSLEGDRWLVDPEGLWVACSNDSDAESVIALPSGPVWQSLLDEGLSLNELWDAALFDQDGFRSQLLNSPLIVGDGTAVFDVRLSGRDRFRVSLPERVAVGLETLVESNGRGSVVLEGPAATVSISFEFCRNEDDMVPNRLGSSISLGPDVVRFCRPDELLSTAVQMVGNVEAELDLFDVRPIAVGSTYGPVLKGFWTDLAGCSNCSRWGPMTYPDAGVVINRTGSTRVTAVSLDDLAEVWTVETGGFDTHLKGGSGAVYLDITGGGFQRRDAATGALEWEIDREEDEGTAVLAPAGDTTWLLASSFQSEGNSRAPLLRAINIETGAIRWTAEGREWAKWQATAPVQIGELIVMMDVTDFPQVEVEPMGGSLRAYDIDSGGLVWVTDLESPTEGYQSRLMFVLEFEDGKALIVKTLDGELLRIDPTNGEVMWRTAVGNAQIDGTVFSETGQLSVSLSGGGPAIALNPRTGGPVEPAA